MGMVMASVRMSEATFMPKVSGRRSTILSQTGRWSPLMDRPKSSLTRRESQFTYCTVSGWSRP